jgi:hypothetical protein
MPRDLNKSRPYRCWPAFPSRCAWCRTDFLSKFKAIAKRAGLNCGNCKTTINTALYQFRMVAGACNVPNLLVVAFRVELVRAA